MRAPAPPTEEHAARSNKAPGTTDTTALPRSGMSRRSPNPTSCAATASAHVGQGHHTRIKTLPGTRPARPPPLTRRPLPCRALVTAPERQSERQRSLLTELEHANRPLYSAYLLKEQLRALYRLPDRDQAPQLFDLWLDSARASGLAAFERLADSLARFRDSILAAIRLGLSNGRLEGINAKIRLLSHRSFGFHTAKPLIALVYLCCSGIQITPPLR
jgi:transposase